MAAASRAQKRMSARPMPMLKRPDKWASSTALAAPKKVAKPPSDDEDEESPPPAPPRRDSSAPPVIAEEPEESTASPATASDSKDDDTGGGGGGGESEVAKKPPKPTPAPKPTRTDSVGSSGSVRRTNSSGSNPPKPKPKPKALTPVKGGAGTPPRPRRESKPPLRPSPASKPGIKPTRPTRTESTGSIKSTDSADDVAVPTADGSMSMSKRARTQGAKGGLADLDAFGAAPIVKKKPEAAAEVPIDEAKDSASAKPARPTRPTKSPSAAAPDLDAFGTPPVTPRKDTIPDAPADDTPADDTDAPPPPDVDEDSGPEDAKSAGNTTNDLNVDIGGDAPPPPDVDDEDDVPPAPVLEDDDVPPPPILSDDSLGEDVPPPPELDDLPDDDAPPPPDVDDEDDVVIPPPPPLDDDDGTAESLPPPPLDVDDIPEVDPDDVSQYVSVGVDEDDDAPPPPILSDDGRGDLTPPPPPMMDGEYEGDDDDAPPPPMFDDEDEGGADSLTGPNGETGVKSAVNLDDFIPPPPGSFTDVSRMSAVVVEYDDDGEDLPPPPDEFDGDDSGSASGSNLAGGSANTDGKTSPYLGSRDVRNVSDSLRKVGNRKSSFIVSADMLRVDGLDINPPSGKIPEDTPTRRKHRAEMESMFLERRRAKGKRLFRKPAPLQGEAVARLTRGHLPEAPPPPFDPCRESFSLPDSEDNIQLADNNEGSRQEVRAGTIEKLVERLAYDKYPDPAYTQAFLLTYRTFMKPDELLALLVGRYNMSPPPEVRTLEEEMQWRDGVLYLVRLRVFAVIKAWVSSHFVDFQHDPELLDQLLDFCDNTLTYTGMEKPVLQIRKLVESRMGIRETKTPVKAPVEPPPPLMSVNAFEGDINFENVPALEFARQLALLEHSMLCSIESDECLGQGWTKKDETRSPNIRRMIRHSTVMSLWAVTTVVSGETADDRKRVLCKFIEIAEHCKELNNYNGMMEIVAGLQMTPIYRLKELWESLPTKTAELFERQKAILSPSSNYKNLRAALKSTSSAALPYLGMYLTDLTFTEDGLSDELENGLINFQKRRLVAQVIGQIQSFQKRAYNVAAVEGLQDWISNVEYLTEDECYKLSLEVQPKQGKTKTPAAQP